MYKIVITEGCKTVGVHNSPTRRRAQLKYSNIVDNLESEKHNNSKFTQVSMYLEGDDLFIPSMLVCTISIYGTKELIFES